MTDPAHPETVTAEQRQAAFVADLREVLRKHGAELHVTDDHREYGMQSGVCQIDMDGRYDTDGNALAEFTEFELPSFMDGDDDES